jgi:hypothetical protein
MLEGRAAGEQGMMSDQSLAERIATGDGPGEHHPVPAGNLVPGPEEVGVERVPGADQVLRPDIRGEMLDHRRVVVND